MIFIRIWSSGPPKADGLPFDRPRACGELSRAAPSAIEGRSFPPNKGSQVIGKTNLVDGIVAEPGVVTRGGLRFRVASGDLTVGDPVTLSIRPHQIDLVGDHQAGAVSARGDNLLRGTVQRASYLGDAVDCQVQLDGSDVILRVAAPPGLRIRQGETVRLAVPPSACIPLAEEGK